MRKLDLFSKRLTPRAAPSSDRTREISPSEQGYSPTAKEVIKTYRGETLLTSAEGGGGPNFARDPFGIPHRITIASENDPQLLQPLAIRKTEITAQCWDRKETEAMKYKLIGETIGASEEEREEFRAHLPPRKRNGVVELTEGMREDIREHMRRGGTLLSYVRAVGGRYPAELVVGAVKRDKEFSKELQAIRKGEGADAVLEAALRIGTEPQELEEQVEVYNANGDLITRSIKRADNPYARKLAFQAYMTYLEKVAPDRFGKDAGKNVESGSMAQKIVEARKRVAQAARDFSKIEESTPLSEPLPGTVKREEF